MNAQTLFNSISEGIGTKVILSVRHFEPDARFAYPGASFEPKVTQTSEYVITLDSAACFSRSRVPRDGGRFYISSFQFAELLMQQHGVRGPIGITLIGIA